MTIREAIELVDKLKPNQYDWSEKVAWLSELDGIIYRETIITHEGYPTDDDGNMKLFGGYTDDTDVETELLVMFPYDEVYRWWLEMKIDDANMETTKYNNSMSKYNTVMNAFNNEYNKYHMPLQRVERITF